MRGFPILSALLIAACSKSEPPAPAAPAAPVPAAPAAPAPSAPVPAVPAVPAPAAPAAPAPATPAEPDDKTLEHSPGLTAPLPLVKAAAPKPFAGLAGAPGESPAMGAPDADALVKVFVFSDFQCPVCRRAVEPLKKLVRAFPEVQVVFKQHPLPMHQRADAAARASMAAFAQGRFWEMHDRLFEAQNALDDGDLANHAQGLGLDMTAWQAALNDPKVAAQIAYESAQAEKLEANGTPAFFVNGEKTVGWGSYYGVEAQVRQALEAAKALLAKGVPKADVARQATAAKDAAIAAVLFGE